MHRLFAKVRDALGHPTENLLAKFVALNILGSLGTSLVGFAGSVALARWLGPSNRGLLALMISVSSLTLYLVGIGVPWATVYYSSRRDRAPDALFGNTLVQAAVMGLVLIPASWLFHQQLADLFGHGEGGLTWVLAAALVPLTFLEWTTGGQLQGMLLFARYNAVSVLAKVVYVLAILALLGGLKLSVTAGVIATGAAAVAMVLGTLRPILKAGRPRFERRLFAAMLRYGSRVQIGSIFQIAMARLDVVILQFFRPLSQVGYYVVAQTIAELVLQLTRAFQASVLPLVSTYEGDERQARTSADSLRHHSILASVAILFNAGFGSFVIFFVYGSKFEPAIVPMLLLLPGVWFLGMGGVIQSDLSGRGRPGTSSRLAGVAAVVTIVLDLALIPPLGVYGAVFASVTAYTVYGVASLFTLHRVSGIPLRALAVPTRADLALYWHFIRHAPSRLRPSPRGAH